MFETVKAIHEALHTQSTLVFVLFVAMLFAVMSGGSRGWWTVDIRTR